jgi:hypothetical protein
MDAAADPPVLPSVPASAAVSDNVSRCCLACLASLSPPELRSPRTATRGRDLTDVAFAPDAAAAAAEEAAAAAGSSEEVEEWEGAAGPLRSQAREKAETAAR